MTMTKQNKARQRRAATVEYVAFAFDNRGLYMDKVQFLSTPVLHVNGPHIFAYKTLNSRFISDFNEAFWKEWPSYSLPSEFTIFRCDDDGYMRAVLRLDENGWTCLQHENCKLRQVR